MISSVIYTWKKNVYQYIQIVKEGYFLFLISVYILYIIELAIVLGAVVVVIICQLDLQLPVESEPITTKVVSSNLTHGKV